MIKEECKAGREALVSNFEHQYTIIPYGDFRVETSPAISTDMSVADLLSAKDSFFYIVGCVIYGSRLDDVLHQTEFYAPVEIIDGTKGLIRLKDAYAVDAD